MLKNKPFLFIAIFSFSLCFGMELSERLSNLQNNVELLTDVAKSLAIGAVSERLRSGVVATNSEITEQSTEEADDGHAFIEINSKSPEAESENDGSQTDDESRGRKRVNRREKTIIDFFATQLVALKYGQDKNSSKKLFMCSGCSMIYSYSRRHKNHVRACKQAKAKNSDVC